MLEGKIEAMPPDGSGMSRFNTSLTSSSSLAVALVFRSTVSFINSLDNYVRNWGLIGFSPFATYKTHKYQFGASLWKLSVAHGSIRIHWERQSEVCEFIVFTPPRIFRYVKGKNDLNI